uniref:Short-chain dehydrogenase/reductase 3 n=1 Tax=Meloidogyne incognita TaxID=6306 RepID=A0A914MYQ6_MELIC
MEILESINKTNLTTLSNNVLDKNITQWNETTIFGIILFSFVLFPGAMFMQQSFPLFFQMLWTVIISSILAMIKSILPTKFLPKKSIKGQTILITGSGSGMGRLMAIEFGKLGGRIVLWDIDEKMNLQTKGILDDLGIQSAAYQIDLSDRKQIYILAEQVKKEVGDIDILINNAGIVSGKKIFDCQDELMEKTMAVNCNALFFANFHLVKISKKEFLGHIVNVASLAGLAGINGLVDYCASKHGAVGLSEALRSELLSQGLPITVTTVCPYYVNTGMFDGVKTFTPYFFPILDPNYVVKKIIGAVLTDADELYLPRATYFLIALKGIFPTKAATAFMEYFGFNRTMNTWTGKKQ